MAKYQIGIPYTVWIEVEANNKEQALDNALAEEYNFIDAFNNINAKIELNEFEDPIIHEFN